MAGNSGGPWGGGDNNGSGGRDDDDRKDDRNGGRRPNQGDGPQIPEIDELVNRGREQLRVLMGGGNGGGNGRRPNGGSGGPSGPALTRGTIGLAVVAGLVLWSLASFYTVRPEEKSVELFLGEYSKTGGPGLHFAPWPFVTREIVQVTQEQRIDIGTSQTGLDAGLMLTGDENIVDIDFQVVWNITEPDQFLFTLDNPEATIEAVAESAMREIIAQSELAPILNTDRESISDRLKLLIQQTLDTYDSGVNIIRVNFNKAEAPDIQVRFDNTEGVSVSKSPFDAFREVQNAEQDRTRLQNIADAYANRVVAQARGQAAQTLEEAEGYRARVVNEAEGEAARFSAVLTEYQLAPEVTRKRIYLETMETVLGDVDIILLDENEGEGQGVVPYLPLNELRRGGSN